MHETDSRGAARVPKMTIFDYRVSKKTQWTDYIEHSGEMSVTLRREAKQSSHNDSNTEKTAVTSADTDKKNSLIDYQM